MEKVLEKELIKQPKKRKISKFNLGMIALTIISVGLIVYALYSYISHPNTYEELEPMMEEALLFDQKAAEYSGQYENIEDQIGEDAYFQLLEEDFEDAAIQHQQIIADFDENTRLVQEAGGITTFEELQVYKKPVLNSFDAQSVATEFGDESYQAEANQAQTLDEPEAP